MLWLQVEDHDKVVVTCFRSELPFKIVHTIKVVCCGSISYDQCVAICACHAVWFGVADLSVPSFLF